VKNLAIQPVRWSRQAVLLLDQRLLPHRERYLRCTSSEAVARAIERMVVRGAPAIGVAAAMGLALGAHRLARRRGAGGLSSLRRGFSLQCKRMLDTRPTAVNLHWAIQRMQRTFEGAASDSAPGMTAIARRLEREALAIQREDVEANRRMGRHGAGLVPRRATILTHCNAGALATAGYGTALGVVRAAREAGKRVEVLADETRPFLQGARLTAWELKRDRIPVTLITDNMAGHFLRLGEADLVLVGADRIAANGDVANKIGTYPLAVLARENGVPFYVAAPLSTLDPRSRSGADIPIEERSASEVTSLAGRRIAPRGVKAEHPAFDVTPSRLVTAIITEAGVARPPYRRSLAALLRKSRTAARPAARTRR
jgi:methylthioribose-1-phosphate isomerase